MRKYIFFIMIPFIFASALQADPWGKDADLACPSKCTREASPKQCKTPFLGLFAEVCISFHQKIVSPADGPRSHFLPSSSRYTLEAMRKYGFYRGFLMGCDRLTRENGDPWVYRIALDPCTGKWIKIDPVR